MKIYGKYLNIFILPSEVSHSWLCGFRIFKFSYFNTYKFPRFLSRNLNRMSFIISYIKTFFKYSFFSFPIYVMRTEYDYVDHASSSYPQKFNTGFSFWWAYHAERILELFYYPHEIDKGYYLYLDFISREEYLDSEVSSRDYALEAFEDGHPSTIRNGGF